MQKIIQVVVLARLIRAGPEIVEFLGAIADRTHRRKRESRYAPKCPENKRFIREL